MCNINKTSKIIIGIIIVLVLTILVKDQFKNKPIPNSTITTPATDTTDTVTDNTKPAPTTEAKNTWYTDYSEEAFNKATSNGQKVVIFFHANWCPSCLAADKDFEANQNQIPENVTILKADYDTASDLKKKYQITTQDTFVQVDKSGTEVAKWNSGGQGIKTLLSNLI